MALKPVTDTPHHVSEQHQIIETVSRMLHAQQDIAAAWLCGSYGRGDSDDMSDIDITACMRDSGHIETAFCRLLKMIESDRNNILTKALPHSMTIHSIDDKWRRCDIKLIDKNRLRTINRAAVKILFDKDHLDPFLDNEKNPKKKISHTDLTETTIEFIRVIGLLPVAMKRREYVSAQSGSFILKERLIRLMHMENPEIPRRGLLSLSKGLTPEQYNILAGMPTVDNSPNSIYACAIYLAGAFFPLAKKLYEREGLPWPVRFEEMTRRHLKETLDLEIIG